jgi:hypothetical protein
MPIVRTWPVTPHSGLESAVRDGSVNDVRAFLEAGTDGRPDEAQVQESLRIAVDQENHDMITILLQHGAELDAGNFCRLTRCKDPVRLLQTFYDNHKGDWQRALNEIMAGYPAL